MTASFEPIEEKIIKSKLRVQKHGEVFTPQNIVKKMLDVPGIREACESVTTTFLEPAAGEGAFLTAILRRKLKMVTQKYNDDLVTYENYSLLALSTLYGIELLEDNAQTCVINMFQIYYEFYQDQTFKHEGKMKHKVLDSAKVIISNNIAQGNFLTRLAADGTPLIFSEWTPINFGKKIKHIQVERTEYTLDEIFSGKKKNFGEASSENVQDEQLSIFDYIDEMEGPAQKERKSMKYVLVKISDVYKEEMEEVDG